LPCLATGSPAAAATNATAVEMLIDPDESPYPTRCEPIGGPPEDAVKFSYYGWQDKSGDVWLDLASTLLKEGLARVAEGAFPERDEYLQYEQQAREQRIGIWA